MEIASMAEKSDIIKKDFNWKIISAASFVVITAVVIGAEVLGDKLNIKLPKQKL